MKLGMEYPKSKMMSLGNYDQSCREVEIMLKICKHFFPTFRIAIEKLAQGNYFKHPLYTFCPEFSKEIIPFHNITPKTSLAKVMAASLHIVPSDFLIKVTDG